MTDMRPLLSKRAATVDVTGEQTMNLKLKGTGVKGGGGGFLTTVMTVGESEMKVIGNFCYLAGGLIRNVAGAAGWGVGECVSVSVALCHSWLSSTAEVYDI